MLRRNTFIQLKDKLSVLNLRLGRILYHPDAIELIGWWTFSSRNHPQLISKRNMQQDSKIQIILYHQLWPLEALQLRDGLG